MLIHTGWKIRKDPAVGEVFFLTFPFIELLRMWRQRSRSTQLKFLRRALAVERKHDDEGIQHRCLKEGLALAIARPAKLPHCSRPPRRPPSMRSAPSVGVPGLFLSLISSLWSPWGLAIADWKLRT